MHAILFDLDNTLIDRDYALNQALLHEFDRPEKVESLLKLDASGYGSRSDFLASWSHMSGSLKTMPDLSDAISEYLEPDQKMLSALSNLSQQVPLGIISNGGVENQWAKIHSAGLGRCFNEANVWISGELPYEKPDREIFQLACKSLNVSVSETLFIGDHPVVDVQGALNAGLHARLITRVVDAQFIDYLTEYI